MYQSIFSGNSESFKKLNRANYNETFEDAYESYDDDYEVYGDETFVDNAEAFRLNPFRKKTLREKAVKLVKDTKGNVVKVVKTKGGKLITIVKNNPWKTAGVGVAAAGIPLAGAYYYKNKPTMQSGYEDDGYDAYADEDIYEANDSFGYYEEASVDAKALKAEHKELAEAIFAKFKEDVNSLRAELTEVIKSSDNPALVERAKKAYLSKLEALRTRANNEIVRTNVRYNGAYDTAGVEAKIAKYVANADNIAYKVGVGAGVGALVGGAGAGAYLGGKKLANVVKNRQAAKLVKKPGFVRRNIGKLVAGGVAAGGAGAAAADHFLNNGAYRDQLIELGKGAYGAAKGAIKNFL